MPPNSFNLNWSSTISLWKLACQWSAPNIFWISWFKCKNSRAENSTSYSFSDSASLNIASESSLAGTKKFQLHEANLAPNCLLCKCSRHRTLGSLWHTVTMSLSTRVLIVDHTSPLLFKCPSPVECSDQVCQQPHGSSRSPSLRVGRGEEVTK